MRSFWLYILLLLSLAGKAKHLVGGEITYECLGNNNYEFTLTIYRDCQPTGQTAFDANAAITVYDMNNNVILNLAPPLFSDKDTLPLEAPNNCSNLSSSVCTEVGIYKITANLPPIPGGYTVTHQRCCRNATILNIPNPGNWGSTYTVEIPSNDVACNSSPNFAATPPVLLCVNQPVTLDMSATDSDGDSLSYSICNVKHGGGRSVNPPNSGFNSPAPNPAAPPPYSNVPFSPGFSFSNPVTSNPGFVINSQTGILRGTPTQLGQYVFAICVTEWRNGQMLSTIRRDFQFNISGDCVGPISIAEDQIMNPNTLCSGLTIPFKSISLNTTSWRWDFGDTTTLADTSRLAHPSYTFPDTGLYTVTLIANPGSLCQDTSILEFRVYYPVSAGFTYTGETCYGVNSINFEAEGSFSPQAKISWDFGGATNIGQTSDLRDPSGVSYDLPGAYEISISIEDFECSDTYKSIIYVYPNPVLISTVPQTQECAPARVSFIDSSVIFGLAQHTWIFGDGTISNDKSPVHIYEEPGIYTVEHYVKTFQGCIDSVYESYPQVIEVFPSPVSKLKIDPIVASIYDPVVNIENEIEGNSNSETILPDGRKISNLLSETLTFEDTGTYPVTHIAFNQFGCTDTLVEYIVIDAPVNLFVPNAFSPNNDGLNDEFKISITGIVEFRIEIFSRWGEMVFQSDDLNYSWNGRYMNEGRELKDQSYTYRIKVLTKEQRRTIVKHGSINIIK